MFEVADKEPIVNNFRLKPLEMICDMLSAPKLGSVNTAGISLGDFADFLPDPLSPRPVTPEPEPEPEPESEPEPAVKKVEPRRTRKKSALRLVSPSVRSSPRAMIPTPESPRDELMMFETNVTANYIVPFDPREHSLGAWNSHDGDTGPLTMPRQSAVEPPTIIIPGRLRRRAYRIDRTGTQELGMGLSIDPYQGMRVVHRTSPDHRQQAWKDVAPRARQSKQRLAQGIQEPVPKRQQNIDLLRHAGLLPYEGSMVSQRPGSRQQTRTGSVQADGGRLEAENNDSGDTDMRVPPSAEDEWRRNSELRYNRPTVPQGSHSASPMHGGMVATEDNSYGHMLLSPRHHWREKPKTARDRVKHARAGLANMLSRDFQNPSPRVWSAAKAQSDWQTARMLRVDKTKRADFHRLFGASAGFGAAWSSQCDAAANQPIAPFTGSQYTRKGCLQICFNSLRFFCPNVIHRA